MNQYEELKDYIASLGSVAVAYSGGVDSTLLLFAAYEVFGDKVLALTALSPLLPNDDKTETASFCEKYGIRHRYVEYDALSVEGLSANPKNRCYICKKAVFGKLLEVASEEGISNVVEGSNIDDLGDYRPGLKAIEELGIISPLRKVGLEKTDIRAISKELGLGTWDKPSFACLASRIPYGDEITIEKLRMIDKAEGVLSSEGFKEYRVRLHGNLARIELKPEDFGRVLEEDIRVRIYENFKSIGFVYVSLDIKGFRSGSMNESLQNDENKCSAES